MPTYSQPEDLVVHGPQKRNTAERATNNPDFEAARRKHSKAITASTVNGPTQSNSVVINPSPPSAQDKTIDTVPPTPRRLSTDDASEDENDDGVQSDSVEKGETAEEQLRPPLKARIPGTVPEKGAPFFTPRTQRARPERGRALFHSPDAKGAPRARARPLPLPGCKGRALLTPRT
ncbi:hypothetical protein H0H92_008821 [Tricholoma furcatifolium]|nr:hypothetical protein H0H92_008821 [Tricholoma furcatifolium]